MRRLATLLPLFVLAACSKQEASPPQPSASATTATTKVEDGATAEPAQPVKVVESNALYSFSYAYPAAAAAIPALKGQLDAELDEARTGLARDAKAGRDEARGSGFDFNPYENSIEWSVVAEVPGWLSMLGRTYVFSGGAHGNSASVPLLWDAQAGRRREPLSLFLSADAFNAATRGAFCAALNRERAKRREEAVDPNSGDEFDRCLDPGDLTVLLGSSDKAHFTRIGLIADPYMAGPYAEGEYEVTVAVTPAIIEAVKPEYRALFAAGR